MRKEWPRGSPEGCCPTIRKKCQSRSRAQLFATPWTVACQAPLSMGLPRQEYWSGLPFPSPGDLPHQGPNPCLLHWQAVSLQLSHQGSPLSNYQTLNIIPKNQSSMLSLQTVCGQNHFFQILCNGNTMT